MKIYDLYIDDSGSTFSHAHSFGLFTSMENVGKFLETLDWYKQWMTAFVEIRDVDPPRMQDTVGREVIRIN